MKKYDRLKMYLDYQTKEFGHKITKKDLNALQWEMITDTWEKHHPDPVPFNLRYADGPLWGSKYETRKWLETNGFRWPLSKEKETEFKLRFL